MEETDLPKPKVVPTEVLRSKLERGHTLYEIFGVPAEAMHVGYRRARNMYLSHHYAEAADAFFALATLDSHNALYWSCLGNAERKLEHWHDAIRYLLFAQKFDPYDPYTYFYQAECVHKLGETETATQILQHAYDLSKDDPDYADLAAHLAKSLGLPS